MKTATLIPQVSVGGIKFDDAIENYPRRTFEYSDKAGEESYSCFAFEDSPVQAFVNGEGVIESLRCETECLWQGVNLIGLSYEDWKKLVPEEPDESDRLSVTSAAGEQQQDVYDYDELGLQVWVYNGKIVVIMASRFEE